MPDGPVRAAARAHAVVLGLFASLALVVVLALLHPAGPGMLATAALLVPLALPLRGLLRRDRRTYAWATLCLTPHFVYALTELVANPPLRLHAAAMLMLSLALMVALVAYLRLTRAELNSE